MKFLKGLFVIIAIIGIAFSAFFVVASATGNIATLTKIEAGIAKLAGNQSSSSGLSSDDSTSTVSMLTNSYGLTTSQAGQLINLAQQLGVNANDPAEMNRFIAKNADKAEEIREVADLYQSGKISETQAKKLLAGIVNV